MKILAPWEDNSEFKTVNLLVLAPVAEFPLYACLYLIIRFSVALYDLPVKSNPAWFEIII